MNQNINWVMPFGEMCLILLLSSRQLTAVGSILFLVSFSASSQLELSGDPSTDPNAISLNYSALAETGDAKPDLPTPLFTMQYESSCVNIYDSQTTLRNQKIYFYSPIAQLNPLNAVAVVNQATTRGNLSIGFSIWNQNVTDKVAQHLTRVLNQNVEPNQVKVYPFDRVRLTSKVQSVDFSLTNEWQTFNTSRQSQRFGLTCPTREDCGRVKTRMQSNPEQFQHLRLEFYPQLNDGFNDAVGIIQVDLSKQVKELAKSLEETKLNFMKELTKAKQQLDDFRQVAQKELDSTKMELINTKTIVQDLMTKLNNNRMKEITDIGRMPESCVDLHRIGHELSGFFAIKGKDKIQTVYCNFKKQPTDQNFQNTIGFVDVKSIPVYFHVHRLSNYDRVDTVIPFDKFTLNVGNAMSYSGVFEAPRPGKYFFSFSGLSDYRSVGRVDLQVKTTSSDWYKIGQAFGESHYQTLALQSTLQLAQGDEIRLMLREGVLHDGHSIPHGPFTHFVGRLIEEDLILTFD